jgi:hypothetical protein
MKAKVSLQLSTLKPAQLVEFAKGVVLAMNGNTNFVSPVPTLNNITLAANALDSAITAAQDKSTLHIEQQNAAVIVLADKLTQLGMYVESTANGNASVILSAAMPVKHNRNVPQQPVSPTHVSATNTKVEGQVEIKWKGVKNARVYVVEQSNDVAAINPTTTNTTQAPATARSFITWTITDIITKPKLVVNGLTSGSKYAFRVYAIGAGGKSIYSTVVVVKAL